MRVRLLIALLCGAHSTLRSGIPAPAAESAAGFTQSARVFGVRTFDLRSARRVAYSGRASVKFPMPNGDSQDSNMLVVRISGIFWGAHQSEALFQLRCVVFETSQALAFEQQKFCYLEERLSC